MNPHQDIREEDFPASIADVVRAIGIPATLKLAGRYGGTRFYVPRQGRLTERHPIVRLIGTAAAHALSKEWRGEWREFPRCVKALARARDAAIRREFSSAAASKLALKYGLTERTIYQIGRVPALPSGRKKR